MECRSFHGHGEDHDGDDHDGDDHDGDDHDGDDHDGDDHDGDDHGEEESVQIDSEHRTFQARLSHDLSKFVQLYVLIYLILHSSKKKWRVLRQAFNMNKTKVTFV